MNENKKGDDRVIKCTQYYTVDGNILLFYSAFNFNCTPCNRIKPFVQQLVDEKKLVKSDNEGLIPAEVYKFNVHPFVPYFILKSNKKDRTLQSSQSDEVLNFLNFQNIV